MTDDELDQRLRENILSEEVDTSRIETAVRAQFGAARPRHVPGWSIAAAAMIATVFAAGLSYRAFLKEQAIPVVCDAALRDHNAEIVRNEPRRWLTELPAIQTLAEKQGVPAAAVAALDRAGYKLERGRLCFLNRQIFLHLVYAKNSTKYSVYLRRHDADSSFDNSVRGTEILAYFQTPHLTGVFVSQDADAISFARAVAKVL